jgi:hypothetical protein
LKLTLGQANGTAGTFYMDAILTNTSTSCTLNGYPKVILTSSSGQQLGQPASQNTTAQPTTITLKTDQMAHASIGFPDPANFSAAACSAKAAYLELTPPGQTTSLQIASDDQYCPGFSVMAIQSGS